MLEPEKRTLLVAGKNCTLWDFWMRGRSLKKGLGIICSAHVKLGSHSAKLDTDKHASAPLACEKEIHQQRYKNGTFIEEHFNSFQCESCNCNVTDIDRLSNLQENPTALGIYLDN